MDKYIARDSTAVIYAGSFDSRMQRLTKPNQVFQKVYYEYV